MLIPPAQKNATEKPSVNLPSTAIDGIVQCQI